MTELNPVVELAIRLGICMLFAGSVVHKLRSPSAFLATVDAYVRGSAFAVLPFPWIAASIVVAMEIAIVAFSLIPALTPVAGAAAAAMLLLYAVAMAANITRGNVLLDCGCAWSETRQPVSMALVLRNLVLAAGAGLLLLPASSKAAGAFELLNAVFLAGLLLLLYVVSNQLILNAQQMKAKRI